MTQRNLLTRVLATLGRLDDPNDAPLPTNPLQPHVESRRFSYTHYNVVIADLPEPHRFLACMVLIGRSGMKAFDVDHAQVTGPGRTATLTSGTAETPGGWFRGYSVRAECEFADDGSLIRIGDELEITGTFPQLAVRLTQPGLEVSLDLVCTGQVTWFARSFIYEHVGFPAHYTGTITWQGQTTPISGICSLEHFRATTPAVLGGLDLPKRLRLPADFFTYQVMQLAPETMLCLADTAVSGRKLMTGAFLKQADGEEARWLTDVRLDVLEMNENPHVAPDGDLMLLPRRYRWRVGNEIDLIASVDCDWIYGVGRGWISGVSYQGTFRGEEIAGRGYVEWVDVRANPT